MYIPEQFRMADEAEALALMRAHPFAVLVSHGASGIAATHLPTLVKQSGGETTIEAHFARANPHWKALAAAPGAEVMAIYSGPHAYIRPGWYPAKAEHGKVVPTWNYAVVHAHARAEIVQDGGWLARHVGEITDSREQGAAGAWSTADAPAGYIEVMTRGIVGVRLTVVRLEGKVKMSQNRDAADALGAAAGLDARGEGADAAVASAIRGARTSSVSEEQRE